MRAIFYSVKGTGHVNPMLPLVRALALRGHDVTCVLTREWKDRVEALGARYHNTGEGDTHFTTAAYHPSGLFLRELMPAAVAVVPHLLEHARGLQPDVIVYDTFAPWARVIGDVLGCPMVASISTLIMSQAEVRANFGTREERCDAYNQQALATLKQRWGVDLSNYDLGLWYAPDNFSYSCAGLNPAAAEMSERVHFVGPLVATGDDGARELATHGLRTRAELGGRKRVYASMGTMVGEMRSLQPAFFTPFIEAFARRVDWEMVISVGKTIDPQAFGTLPDNVIVRQSVPQVALLPHVDVFITHAGANSMHESLLFGVPMVCIPCFGDQPYNANRIVKAGAGLPLVYETLNTGDIRAQVDRVAADATFRANAEELSAELRAAGGIERAMQVVTDAAARRV
jgi:MGT family glycosyltransferase